MFSLDTGRHITTAIGIHLPTCASKISLCPYQDSWTHVGQRIRCKSARKTPVAAGLELSDCFTAAGANMTIGWDKQAPNSGKKNGLDPFLKV